MRLRNKLFLAQTPLVTALLVLGIVAAATVSRLGSHSQVILKDNYRSILAAERMKEAVDGMKAGVLLMILGGHREDGARAARDTMPRFESELDVQVHNVTEPGEQEATDLLRARWLDCAAHLDDFLRLNGETAGGDEFFKDLLPRFRSVKEQADVILAINQVAMVRKSEDVQKFSGKMDTYMLSATVLAIAAGVLASVILLSRLLRPLTVLSQAVRQIGLGDFSVRAQVPGKDEVGLLAQEFNAMAQGLERYRKSSLGEFMLAKHMVQATMDSLPDPVISFDLAGQLISANQAAEEGLDIRPDQLFPDPVVKLDPELRTAVTRARTHVLSGKGSYLPSGLEEAVRVGMGGTEGYYLPMASPVYGDMGNLAGVTVVLRDVGVLRKLDEMSSDLVATFAHEFRTPLTSLHMAIHVCLEQLAGPLTEKQDELLHAGREECERLQAMINDLLDIARIQAGRMEMRKLRIDLRPVLDVVIEQHRLLVEEKGLAISRRVPPECEFTYADPDRLELILSNLFNNAIRHTPPGGSIELRARMTEAGVRFEVADTGEGIPAQYQDQVFEKFFRVPGRAGGASGLGLSMAKNVVEACGGRIGVESIEGQGSTFWFVLPEAPPEATPNGPTGEASVKTTA